MPMQEALSNLPLSDEVMAGLLDHKGLAGDVLLMTLAYERGQWDDLLKAKVAPDVMQKNYLEAIRWTTEAAKSLAN